MVKHSKYTKAYNKERRRIEKYINDLKSKGISVEYEIPKKPKTITKNSVSRLQKVSPDVILQKSYIYNPQLNRTVSGRGVLGTAERFQSGIDMETGEIYDDKAFFKSEVSNALESTSSYYQEELPRRSEIVTQRVIDEISSQTDIDFNQANADTTALEFGLYTLENPSEFFNPQWNDWYANQKFKQVNKALTGIKQAISERGIDEVAQIYNENAKDFNDAIDAAVGDSGDSAKMAEIDLAIDNMIARLTGAISYSSAMAYAY